MREHVPDPESREPLLSRATIVAVVGAAVTLAVSFGLPLSDAQQIALTALAAAVAPLVAGWWARRRVWSGATVADLVTRPEKQR